MLMDTDYEFRIGDVFDRARRQLAKYNGFYGDAETPVYVESIDKTSSLVLYRLNHIHDADDRCIKNRTGIFCNQEG